MSIAATEAAEKLPSRWVLAEPGPDLPPNGRSLFDHSVMQTAQQAAVAVIPFPISALVRHLEKQAGCKPGGCARRVLIPLGRSLQRTAASPNFFAYPRLVVAIDRESDKAGSMRLKDRVYLGYQEKSGIVEVISYNEAAARFEFQLVKNYRKGATPRVVYANRAVCLACHQNQAPLFSRPQWDETNANPQVAALLAHTKRRFYGAVADVGLSEPNAIDDAVHRANEFALTRLLWREACGETSLAAWQCRAAVLTAALQFRLSGARSFDARTPGIIYAIAELQSNFSSRWPNGLALPNPEIPNRDPLKLIGTASGVEMTHVAAGLEPLALRAPLEIIADAGPELMHRLVKGVSEFLSPADIAELDQELVKRRASARRRHYSSGCEFDRERRFRCEANGAVLQGVVAAGEQGTLESLAIDQLDALRDLELGAPKSIKRNTLIYWPSRPRIRLSDGNALEALRLDTGRHSRAVVTVVEDFAPIAKAIADADANATGVIGRLARLARSRDLAQGTEAGQMPPAEREPTMIASDLPSIAAAFMQHCATCHATLERSPPNFLHGDAERVRAALRSCAPRIFARLSMWQIAPEQRDKTPMPPQSSLAGAAAPPAITALRAAAAAMLGAETGTAPDVATLLARGYEALRPCLPEEGKNVRAE